MCDRQHRESHAPLPDYTASAQRQTDAVEDEDAIRRAGPETGRWASEFAQLKGVSADF
jgi:hypothetical protein